MSGPIIPTSDALNYVVVNGVRSPGRAQLTGVEAPYNWQVQEGYALSGAFITFRGRAIAKPTLTIAMWKAEHFLQWPLFKLTLSPPSTLKPFFVEMQHPLLSSADIKAVGIESLGEPVPQPGGGMWLATIKLIEWRPFKFALVKPNKSIPAVDAGKLLAPKTEADRALIASKQALEAALTAGKRP